MSGSVSCAPRPSEMPDPVPEQGRMAVTEEALAGDWDMFCERIEPEPRKLGLAHDSIDGVKAELFLAAREIRGQPAAGRGVADRRVP